MKHDEPFPPWVIWLYLTIVCLITAGVIVLAWVHAVPAQSMKDIVIQSEGGHMPTRNEFESRAGGHFLRNPDAIRQHSERYFMEQRRESEDSLKASYCACLPNSSASDGCLRDSQGHIIFLPMEQQDERCHDFESSKGGETNALVSGLPQRTSVQPGVHSDEPVKGGETSAPGTTAPGPTTTLPGRATPCLPPGVSLDGLTIIGERHVKAPVDDGSFLQVVSNAWGRGETPVVVLYWLTRQGVPSVLAAVDDDPTGPGKPWVDSTLVRLDGVVITGGHPSCAWKRVGSPAPERL